MKLGVIGTAGRKSKTFNDLDHLDRDLFSKMCILTTRIALWEGFTGLVSGGAAWADHVAVDLCLNSFVDPHDLTIYTPAPFIDSRYRDAGFRSPGNTANYYHRLFSEKVGYNTLEQLDQIKDQMVYKEGANFFSRNTDVAKVCDGLIAFTFGRGPYLEIVEHSPETSAQDAGLKDGGTADTWNKARCRKWHVNLKKDTVL